MKKFTCILIAVLFVAGCKREQSVKKTEHPVDELAAINKQLAGTWLYAEQRSKVVDSTGKILVPDFYSASIALEFDGMQTVKYYQSIDINGTLNYSLSKKGDLNYLTWGHNPPYRIQALNDTSLSLTDTIPANGGEKGSKQIYFYTFVKKKPADTAAVIRAVVKSDSIFQVNTYLTHASDEHSHLFVDSKYILAKSYVYEHAVIPGDYLSIHLDCSTHTDYYFYYKGLALFSTIYRDQYGLWKITSNSAN